MNLSHLQYFIALSEDLNFRRAAKRLGIEQSPLSQAIMRLETAIQTQLLDRTRQNVQLTPAGKAFLPHARTVLRDVAFAHRLAELMRQPDAAIRLGVPTGGLGDLSLQILRDLEKRSGGAQLHLHEAPNAELIHHLQSGEIDVAAVFRPTHMPKNIEFRVIDRSHLIAAIPSTSPWADKGQLSLADLATIPLILFPETAQPQCHAQLMTTFHEIGLVPAIHHQAAHLTTRLALVAAGHGATLLPAGQPGEIPGVSLRVVSDLPLSVYSEVVLAWQAQMPKSRRDIFQRTATLIA